MIRKWKWGPLFRVKNSPNPPETAESLHQGAAGLGISVEHIIDFMSRTDEILKDMPNESIYYVDYIWNPFDNINQNVLDIAKFDPYIGKDFEEPIVAIQNIKVTKNNITMMKSNTCKITLPSGVSLIKFNMPDEEFNQLYSETGVVDIDVVGTCNINSWNGIDYPQVLIKDINIKRKVAYEF